jgi:glycosyltransferase involved in cell wall biosynthesis
MPAAMTGTVSCLTVTKHRLDLLPRAVTCFQRQSYPDRELIVVNDADDGTKEYVASLRDERIRYLRPERDDLRLGELRNVALVHARGTYVAQWDDDDWHHPDRLTAQLMMLEQEEADVCLLRRWTLAWPDRNLFLRSKRRPWEGTMVARREKLPAYEAVTHGEDSVLVEECRKRKQKVCLLDQPDLYLYVVHGRNTYPLDHFANNIFNTHTGELSAEEVADALRKLEWGREGETSRRES